MQMLTINRSSLKQLTFQKRTRYLTILNRSRTSSRRKTQWNEDDSQNDKARMYNIGVLQRSFENNREIKISSFVLAMKKRWNFMYSCYIEDINHTLCIKFFPNRYLYELDDAQKNVDDEVYEALVHVTKVLNKYNIGIQFVDYLMYDNVYIKDPYEYYEIHNEHMIIYLNIPTNGIRLEEWNIRG